MLSWDHKYDVGIERIDAQHHIFFNLVGEFQGARLAGASIEKLESILSEIVLYAKYHFYSELNVMKEHRYPGIAEHQALHYELIDDLSNKVTGMHLKLNRTRDVEDFLVEWFSWHTANEDAKFGRFVLGETEALT